MYLSTTNKAQKDGHIDLHEQLQNINPGQFSSVHIFQKRSIIIQTGTIIKQSQPQDPWNEPLTPVYGGFFEEDGGESAGMVEGLP